MDARAVHRGVAEAVRTALSGSVRERPLRVLEVGGGAGGAFRRWMEVLQDSGPVEFLATDADAALLAAYGDDVSARSGEASCEVRFRQAAVPDGFDDEDNQQFDLLVAQSFWDLLPRGTALRFARQRLAPGGVFHATLTFSGETRFEPSLGELDDRVLACYHESMDAHGGDAHAGEHLIADFREPDSGFSLLSSGRSDWRVEPVNGDYPEDEGFFLETVLGFVEKELRATPNFDASDRDRWLDTRREQLANGQLSFTARQFDIAAKRVVNE